MKKNRLLSSLRYLGLLTVIVAAPLLSSCGSDSNDDNESPPTPAPQPPQAALPNILFVVLDDLGVDQLTSYGYGGATPARTPNLDAISRAGVQFRNAWSMPTCSPGRSTFFTGRYPFRTQVENAILSLDLANSQVSPYETTTPKILKQKGYINAVIGKMHLSGSDLNPDNNPLGDGVMHALGWDYFEGYLDGAPYPIDTTAGGVGDVGDYACGFVPNAHDDPARGADSGACYQANGSCSVLSTASTRTPGNACLASGGIFDPGQSCQAKPPAYLDFVTQNGYYTGEWVINHPNGDVEVVPPSDTSSRGYRSTMETDRAIAWINAQPDDQPWMLSLGYSAIHTPLQPPPESLLPKHAVPAGGFNCTDTLQQRVLSNQMIEAMDKEIGRLLVEVGLARYASDGSLEYRPEETNTVVVVMGDNGTYLTSVKAPFNPQRAKGSPYQTGVWVPLIVAGPMVEQPGREVPHMVNSVDLFELFGELAGTDVHEAVPSAYVVDAEPMLSYLTDPSRASVRDTNYTEVGTNITSVLEEPAPPCVIPAANVCVQIFPQQGVCEDQGGTWYGPGGAAGSTGLASCCAVNDWLQEQGESTVELFPQTQQAIRNDDYKLVRVKRQNCETGALDLTDGLYRVDQSAPLPKLDNAVNDLLAQGSLDAEAQRNYDDLSSELAKLEATEVVCDGDGNRDGMVDATDLANWEFFSTHNGGKSSWYDFNFDGLTDETDKAVIQRNLGASCREAA